jgi:hypothetical protein
VLTRMGEGGNEMSDEQRNNDETEVEAHGAFPPKYGANDEPAEDDENEFEAHIKFPNVRMD